MSPILRLFFAIEYRAIRLIGFFTGTQKAGVAIVKLDAIGDYILFRNFIAEIKNTPAYAGQKLTVVGNQAWKELALAFDGAHVDEFIWINRGKIWSDKFYRFKTLFALSKKRYTTIINPVFSRELHYSDSLVRVMRGERKIASVGDLTNSTLSAREYSKSFYTELIPTLPGTVFEFMRNKDFFEHLLLRKLTTIPALLLSPTQNAYGDYVLLFIGGSAKSKRWSNAHYAELAAWLSQKSSFKIMVCGTKSDLEKPENLEMFNFEGSVNLIGKTSSMLELVPLLHNARLVISNETAVPHLCVTLSTEVVVITHMYGRFTPYPVDLTTKYHAVYHPRIVEGMVTPERVKEIFGNKSDLDIDEISLSSVVECIRPLIHSI